MVALFDGPPPQPVGTPPKKKAELGKVRSRTRGGASTVEVPRSAASHLDSALALAAAVLHLERKPPGRGRAWSSFAGLAPTPAKLAALDEKLTGMLS